MCKRRHEDNLLSNATKPLKTIKITPTGAQLVDADASSSSSSVISFLTPSMIFGASWTLRRHYATCWTRSTAFEHHIRNLGRGSSHLLLKRNELLDTVNHLLHKLDLGEPDALLVGHVPLGADGRTVLA